MSKKTRRSLARALPYFLVTLGALVMVYPLIWLVFSSFKPNEEIFSSTALLPEHFTLDGYVNGWKSSGKYTFSTYFANTFALVIPTVLLTLASSSLVAFGFARFTFPGSRLFFGLMIATMMLPSSVMLVPRYILYRDLSWLDTYMPFYAPALLATNAFFIFMFVQFFRGLPRELDESARMDGCSSLVLFLKIIAPLSKPAFFSAAMFQTMWSWNDFFNPLIYINSVSKYTISLGLRMSMDVNVQVTWSNILAMALVSILPLVLLFFFAQKYFVEGISTTGLKG